MNKSEYRFACGLTSVIKFAQNGPIGLRILFGS
jgi:hypothetical protein